MCLVGKDSRIEGRTGSLLRRLGGAVLCFFALLPTAFLAALREENARADKEAVEDEDQDLVDELSDPPHLEYGEVKYGQGLHDYF